MSATATVGDRRLEFSDGFGRGSLDSTRWLPAYLPQWSSRAQAAPRYTFEDGRLVLQITADQPPWCPRWDGATRVSSIQTGVFSGPVGSPVGQSRFRPDLVVTEAQASSRLYTPRYGRIEMRASAIADPDAMIALWMIGFEDEPDRSGEICVCEIFGRDVRSGSARVGMGIHPFGDPRLIDDFEQVEIAIDAVEPHAYAAEWSPTGVDFLVDDRLVKRTAQSPDYEMQLMLGIYAFEPSGSEGYPKRFVVDHVRGYAPALGRIS
ncbi:MAG TPA: glycoside hydrolase family 16 protein [Candidatus Limnocylindrales bacterium]|nr:glycoside hydrolase family 16 protein [Candidatus Limnocylindrales bacterium]